MRGTCGNGLIRFSVISAVRRAGPKAVRFSAYSAGKSRAIQYGIPPSPPLGPQVARGNGACVEPHGLHATNARDLIDGGLVVARAFTAALQSRNLPVRQPDVLRKLLARHAEPGTNGL